MNPRRLYLDTSVIGGYFDPEFSVPTRLLWKQEKLGRWCFMTSLVAEREIQFAPAGVRKLFAKSFGPGSLLDISLEIEELASAYLRAACVPSKYLDDALHVAMATVHGLPLLVSWNFKHLANIRREESFNAVNLAGGYPLIRIVSPNELIYDHEDED
jgi:hypothetical protein